MRKSLTSTALFDTFLSGSPFLIPIFRPAKLVTWQPVIPNGRNPLTLPGANNIKLSNQSTPHKGVYQVLLSRADGCGAGPNTEHRAGSHAEPDSGPRNLQGSKCYNESASLCTVPFRRGENKRGLLWNKLTLIKRTSQQISMPPSLSRTTAR